MGKSTRQGMGAQEAQPIFSLETDTEFEPVEPEDYVDSPVDAPAEPLVWLDHDMQEPEDYREHEENHELDKHPFWDARPELRTIHDYAKAQMSSPHAVLAGALAEVLAATPHNICLPAIIHGPASLNMFVGLVGESGAGKGGATKVARRAVSIASGTEVFRTAPKSGEAFSAMFGEMKKSKNETDSSSAYEVVRTHFNVMITLDEIDMLTGVTARQGSTIMPTLRNVAMGEFLGGHAMDTTRRISIEALTYRCCLIAGIQPTRSGVIFNDSDGGTPQRFLFVSANDPDCLENPPEPPNPFAWQSPNWSSLTTSYDIAVHSDVRFMGLPDIAVAETKKIAYLKERGEVDPLDGHRNLLRLKVSAALAILAGRSSVNEEDWELSNFIMRHSDIQRSRCKKAISTNVQETAKASGRLEAVREMARNEATANAVISDAAAKLLPHIAKAGEDGLSFSVAGQKVKNSIRDRTQDILDYLVETNAIQEYDKVGGNHKTAKYYRRITHSQ